MSENIPSASKKYLKYKKVIVVSAILVLLISGDFALRGYNFSRAQGHVKKACELLYPLGNPLRANSPFGTDYNQLSAKESLQMTDAASEALSAATAENQYRFFRDEVILFDLNIRGEATTNMENLVSPYLIYTYGIYPVCTNSLQFFDPERINWLPDL